jgi:antitoxin YefM
MQTIPDDKAREKFTSLLDEVARDREPIAITRDGKSTAVLLAADEFTSMEETLHLLSTAANAEEIRKSLADFAAGKLQAANYVIDVASWRVGRLPLLAGTGSQNASENQ